MSNASFDEVATELLASVVGGQAPQPQPKDQPPQQDPPPQQDRTPDDRLEMRGPVKTRDGKGACWWFKSKNPFGPNRRSFWRCHRTVQT